jgi:hypothetical protein
MQEQGRREDRHDSVWRIVEKMCLSFTTTFSSLGILSRLLTNGKINKKFTSLVIKILWPSLS